MSNLISKGFSVQHILVVEDGKDFQLVIRQALSDENTQFTMVETLLAATEALKNNTFDLIVLDIGLPDGDGLQLCSQLQSDDRLKAIPVIFLTADEETSTKVAAFALGAEDYIVKPFNRMEFKARVDAKLKKKRNREVSEQTLVKGKIRIHFLSQRAYLQGDSGEQELNLTPLEFKILAYFARNEERVLSREQILSSVWGPNVHVFDRTVDTHISSLRKKIAPCNHYIQAVLGSGYSFSPKHTKLKKAS